MNDTYLTVKLTTLLQTSDEYEDPDKYVIGYKGDIQILEDEDDIKIGTLNCSYLDLINGDAHGENPFEIADCESNDLAAIVVHIFGSDILNRDGSIWDIKPCIEEMYGDLYEKNILHIDLVELDKKYRGNDYSLIALKYIIERLSHGCSLVTLRVADKKLFKHWGRLGFKQIFDGEFMFLNVSYKWGLDK